MDISLQVQVPSHSLSFEVRLAPGATVLDLKHAIHHQCRGAPSVDGQRLISKGRLLQNTDLVDSIWTVGTMTSSIIPVLFVIVTSRSTDSVRINTPFVLDLRPSPITSIDATRESEPVATDRLFHSCPGLDDSESKAATTRK